MDQFYDANSDSETSKPETPKRNLSNMSEEAEKIASVKRKEKFESLFPKVTVLDSDNDEPEVEMCTNDSSGKQKTYSGPNVTLWESDVDEEQDKINTSKPYDGQKKNSEPATSNNVVLDCATGKLGEKKGRKSGAKKKTNLEPSETSITILDSDDEIPQKDINGAKPKKDNTVPQIPTVTILDSDNDEEVEKQSDRRVAAKRMENLEKRIARVQILDSDDDEPVEIVRNKRVVAKRMQDVQLVRPNVAIMRDVYTRNEQTEYEGRVANMLGMTRTPIIEQNSNIGAQLGIKTPGFELGFGFQMNNSYKQY